MNERDSKYEDEDFPEPPIILWIVPEIKEATVYPDVKERIQNWYLFEELYKRVDHAFHYYDPHWSKTSAISDAGITICGTGIGAMLSLRFSVEISEQRLELTEYFYIILIIFMIFLMVFTYTKSRANEHD